MGRCQALKEGHAFVSQDYNSELRICRAHSTPQRPATAARLAHPPSPFSTSSSSSAASASKARGTPSAVPTVAFGSRTPASARKPPPSARSRTSTHTTPTHSVRTARRHSSAAPHTPQHTQGTPAPSKAERLSYELPDGRTLMLGTERFACAEVRRSLVGYWGVGA